MQKEIHFDLKSRLENYFIKRFKSHRVHYSYSSYQKMFVVVNKFTTNT